MRGTTGRICQHPAMESPEYVWVFHGEGAKFASGVFETRDDAMAWAERHNLTGLLTQYPLGMGAYDHAVENGRFKPSREHHGSPEHIARFSPGHTEHVQLADGGVDDRQLSDPG